jgi:hypothetical protein
MLLAFDLAEIKSSLFAADAERVQGDNRLFSSTFSIQGQLAGQS